MDLPRRLQIDFARRVQAFADDTGAEVTAAELHDLFEASYLDDPSWLALKDWRTSDDETSTEITLAVDGVTHRTLRRGDPLAVLTEALADAGYPIEVLGLTQQSIGADDAGSTLAYLEYRSGEHTGWSCGRAGSAVAAALAAVVRAAGRSARR
jgi:2-isopropylmalate synthase